MTLLRNMCVAAVALLPTALGCSAKGDPSATKEPEPTGATHQALTAFDPCSPDWQLPASDRYALVLDDPNPTDVANFTTFEDRLAEGNATFVGSHGLPKPWRAIVHIDTYKVNTKTWPRSALWFLANVPPSSYDALQAIDDDREVLPVTSRRLGWCTDKGFVTDNGSGKPQDKILSVIVEYDPRCVCMGTENSAMSVWVSESQYSTEPTAR